jgi:fatty-acid peroxygenase
VTRDDARDGSQGRPRNVEDIAGPNGSAGQGSRLAEWPATGRTIPRSDIRLDATLALLRQGYRFISNECDRHDTDIFRTRLLLRDVVCMRGEAAARLFYKSKELTRKGSMPPTTLMLLQDKGSVQQLDGEAHRHRKAMFVRLLMQDRDGLKRLTAMFERHWLARLENWSKAKEIRLASAVDDILAETAFDWAGIPADPRYRRGDVLATMVNKAGGVGPSTWAALARRSSLERALAGLVRLVRRGEVPAPAGSALDVLSRHKDLGGVLLAERVAAVELINILRPIVAIGKYIVFCALRLHEHAEWNRLFQTGHDDHLEDFVEEIRRISPFFPVVGAIATRDITWNGYSFRRGQWLLLDLFGTCHDPAYFPKPEKFKPQRQLSWRSERYVFIPQGAGDPAKTHRCPGELVTVEILKAAVNLLCCQMRYQVPEQDLSVSLKTAPTGPKSGFVITDIAPYQAKPTRRGSAYR